MNVEPDLAEVVKTAGAGSAPIMAAWCVYRIGKLEAKVCSLANHLGAIDCAKHRRNPIGNLTIIVAIVIAGMMLVTGCLTPQQRAWTCQTAADILAAYQIAETAGLVSDPKVISAAKSAADFLSISCGWSTTTRRGNPGDSRPPPAVDRNGVLLVNPPR